VKLTGGEIVVRALEEEGIPFAFGIPGTHNIELYDALAASRSVRPVLVTDEQSASFMADAVWRASGRMACTNVVPGAGLTHALSGIAEAFMDTVPMLVLGCGIRGDTGMAFQLHDVDQASVVAPLCKAVFRPRTGQELYAALRDACRTARTGAPGPVFVEVPADLYLLRQEAELPPREEGREGIPGSGPVVARAGIPPAGAEADAAVLDRAASLLRGSRRPLLYVGAGAADARRDVLRLAELLDAPVATTFQGKGVFPEDHPLFLWPGFGRAAPPFARRIAAERDLTLAVGCRFGEVATAGYGVDPPRPLLHVDIDPSVPGRNFPAELAVAADAGGFLRGVLERLAGEGARGPDEELREWIRDGHAEVWEEWLEPSGGGRVTPAVLLRALQEELGPATIFTTDSGNGTFLAMECLRLREPGKFLAPVDYSCMGYAVPAAIGAKLARPDCPVVALAGDGAFLMTGLELLTAAAEGVGVMVFVLRDRELAQIAQFQETALNRKVASRLPDYDLAAIAAGVGAAFLPLEGNREVAGTIRAAAAEAAGGRPVVVDVAIDYSRRTWFTRGVVRSVLGRLPLGERMRFVGRALVRRLTG